MARFIKLPLSARETISARFVSLGHVIALEETGESRIKLFLTNQREFEVGMSAADFFKAVPHFHEEF